MSSIPVIDTATALLDDDAIEAQRSKYLACLGGSCHELAWGMLDLCDLALAGNVYARERLTASLRGAASSATPGVN